MTTYCVALAVVVLDDMQSAIKVATCKLGLQPGAAFQARVAQLAELVKAHKMVRLIQNRKRIDLMDSSLQNDQSSSTKAVEVKEKN